MSHSGELNDLHQRICNLVVHLLSSLIDEVRPVEGKLLGRLLGGSWLLDETLAVAAINRHHHLAVERFLPVVQRSASDHHLHRLGRHPEVQERSAGAV